MGWRLVVGGRESGRGLGQLEEGTAEWPLSRLVVGRENEMCIRGEVEQRPLVDSGMREKKRVVQSGPLSGAPRTGPVVTVGQNGPRGRG